jgi:hypothetical protein
MAGADTLRFGTALCKAAAAGDRMDEILLFKYYVW